MALESRESTRWRRGHVLFCLSGSVASIKALEIAQGLAQFANVVVVPTKAASHFISLDALRGIEGVDVFFDEDEWNNWHKLKDPVLHIELRKWADVIVVAPLSANTLAKLANGLSDNLLTCIARAWDFKFPFLVAPAMNTMMWEHPFTARHLKELESLGVSVIPPIPKLLACGDIGNGALANVGDIVAAVRKALKDLAKLQQQMQEKNSKLSDLPPSAQHK
jgi:phosphopantothenoylcysteine decarboxylase